MVCPFQPPADYILEIMDENSDVVNSSGLLPSNATCGVISEVHVFSAGLERDRVYRAILTISHSQL